MTEKFEAYALVELFGHQRMAGKVTEQAIGGASFIRIDVPETSRQPGFSRILNPSSIYAINPITLEAMVEVAENLNTAPIQEWDIRKTVAKAKAALEAPKEELSDEELYRMREAERELDFEEEEEEDTWQGMNDIRPDDDDLPL